MRKAIIKKLIVTGSVLALSALSAIPVMAKGDVEFPLFMTTNTTGDVRTIDQSGNVTGTTKEINIFPSYGSTSGYDAGCTAKKITFSGVYPAIEITSHDKIGQSAVQYNSPSIGTVQMNTYVFPVTSAISVSDENINTTNEVYLYEGETVSFTTTNLPYNEANLSKGSFMYVTENALQYDTFSLSDSNVASLEYTEKTVDSPMSAVIAKPTDVTIKALKEGNTVLTINAMDSLGFISNSKSIATKTISIKVRKKPTLKLTANTTTMAFNKTVENAATITVGNKSTVYPLSYDWTSSNVNVAEVKFDGTSIKLISKAKEGTAKISVSLIDDVQRFNPNAVAITKSFNVTVKDYKITIPNSDITNGSEVVIKENNKTIRIEEADNAVHEWTSSNPSVAELTVDGHDLTITKKSVGISTLTCTSNTGNVLTFTVIYKANTPKITSVESINGELRVKYTQVDSAAYYQIYRSEKENGSYENVGSVSSKGSAYYSDTKATYGKTYYYKVVAEPYESKCASEYSNVKSGVKIPATPTIKTATSKYTGYRFDFKAAGDIDGFVFEVGEKGKLETIPSQNNYVQISDKKAFKAGKIYVAKVKGFVVEDGKKVYSDTCQIEFEVVNGSIKLIKSAPVKKFTVKRVTKKEKDKKTGKKKKVQKKSVKVTITKTADVDGYEIIIAENKKFSKNGTTKSQKKFDAKTKKITFKNREKKQFIKVRTYKLVNGKKQYGNWSEIKTVEKQK